MVNALTIIGFAPFVFLSWWLLKGSNAFTRDNVRQGDLLQFFWGGSVQDCGSPSFDNDRARASIRRLIILMARFMRTATFPREM